MSLAITPVVPSVRRVARHEVVDITLEGTADAHALLALRARLVEAFGDGPAIVLLDVSLVTRVTASAVAGMLDLLRVARSGGGDLRVHGAGALSRAHTALRLGAVLVVYDDRDHALSSVH